MGERIVINAHEADRGSEGKYDILNYDAENDCESSDDRAVTGDVDESGMLEFLNNVTGHIRWKQARKPVERELKDHILDQREDFEHNGMSGQQALDAAVKEMGDPAEIGVSMNRIHKPRMSWTLLVMVVMASLVGIALQYMLLFVYRDEQSLSRTAGSILNIADNQISSHIVNNQIVYSIMGVALMLVIRRFDYRKLKKYALAVSLVFSAFFILELFFSPESSRIWFNNTGIVNFRILPLLSVPIFALLIYRYKDQGCSAIIKLFFWNMLFTLIAFLVPAFHSAMIVAASNFILFCIAVAKGWFKVSRKVVFGVIAAILGVCILYVAGIVFSDTVSNTVLKSYQTDRIRYFFGIGENVEDFDYQGITAREIIEGSQSFGYNSENLADAMTRMPGLGNDYTLVGLTAAFGLDVGIFAALLIFAITVSAVVIAVRQRDDLGKILGIGCGLVFFFETLISVLTSLHLMPSAMAVLPLVSQGGSQIFVMYILIGLVLSIQRYRDIATNGYTDVKTDSGDEKIFSKSFELAKLKITIEKS